MDALQNELKSLAKALGIDFFGVADITGAHDFVMTQGGEHIASYPRAVTLGMGLLDAVVDELYRHEEPSALFSYRGIYDTANENLNRAGLLVAKKIQEAGFKAYAIPASQTVNERKLEGAISHKLVAHLAGLGWIGKNCLLITPEHGPRLRLATILTDAPLEVGKPIPNGCGECNECVDICPPKAITGVPFNPSQPRSVRFRAHQCRDYTQRRAQLLGEGICGLCVYTCPYGTKR